MMSSSFITVIFIFLTVTNEVAAIDPAMMHHAFGNFFWLAQDPMKSSSVDLDLGVAASNFVANLWPQQFAQSPLATAINDLKQSNSALVDSNLKETLGSYINANFNGYLDANPKLKLSTSEFVLDYYTRIFEPKAIDTLELLDRSPLAQSTRELASAPTSEIVGKIASATAEKLSPFTNVLSGIANRVGDKLFGGPIEALSASLESFNGAIDKLASTASSLPSIQVDQFISSAGKGDLPSPSLPSFPSFSFDSSLPTTIRLDDDRTKAFQAAIANTVGQITPSLSRAGSTFTAELAEKGSILSTNTGNAVAATGNAIGSIFKGIATIGSNRPPPVEYVVLPGSGQPVAPSAFALKTAQTYGEWARVGDKVSSWTLFPNGNPIPAYVENTRTNLNSLGDLDLQEKAGATWETVKQQWVRVSEANQITSKISGTTADIRFGWTKLSEATSNFNNKGLPDIVNDIGQSTEGIKKSLVGFQQNVNVVGKSASESFNGFVEDSKGITTYVKDFIATNSDQ